jgi:hypothetical protein
VRRAVQRALRPRLGPELAASVGDGAPEEVSVVGSKLGGELLVIEAPLKHVELIVEAATAGDSGRQTAENLV